MPSHHDLRHTAAADWAASRVATTAKLNAAEFLPIAVLHLDYLGWAEATGQEEALDLAGFIEALEIGRIEIRRLIVGDDDTAGYQPCAGLALLRPIRAAA